MRSINIDLQSHLDSGLLLFSASRPTLNGLEMHLLNIIRLVEKFKPNVVVLDPISNLITVGSTSEVKSLLTRLIDFLQSQQITVMFTALALNDGKAEQTDESISSLVDVWILVRDIESNGERNRGLYVMKSRGMKHSNQVREFVITDEGLKLVDVFLGPVGVLTGSARETQQLLERTSEAIHDHAISRKDREIERKRLVLESRIAALKEEFESVQEELNKSYIEDELKKSILNDNRKELTHKRDNLL
jgi:circadian clock protein KaiC